MHDRSAARLRRTHNGVLRFWSDRRGGVLVWASLMIVPLLGFMGLGVDTARGYMVRARLSQALDSAALAAGRQTTNETKAASEAKMIFKANFPVGYMDAEVDGPKIDFDEDGDTVMVSATAEIPTYFVHLIGFDSFSVSASSEVTRRTVFMDVVVSIDVSGSMDEYIYGKKKITAATDAARILVDTLYGTSETKELLKMGLVTWSANARILDINSTYKSNQTISKTVTSFTNPYTDASQNKLYYAKNSPVPLLSSPPSGWTGCTLARFIDDDKNNDGDLHVGQVTIGGEKWMGWEPAIDTITGYTGKGKRKKPVYADLQCPDQGIQRLSNVRGQMISALQQVKNPSGNTNMVMGLMWAWTLLGVPDSGSPFEADATPNPAAGQGEIVRAIVLMTDGDNTQSSTDAYQGDLSKSQLDERTRDAADKIKEAGIVIYAIRFGAGSYSESLLKQVASGPTAPYYQYAPDAASLEAAFKEIGNHLSKLRLSK